MAEDLNTPQKTTQSEQELQLKKRARRRLVGAIALVLAMLVILPMILDDKATKPQAPITISIPDEDNTNFTSKIVPLPAVDANPAGSATVTTPIEKNETVPITSGLDARNAVNPNTIAAEPIKMESLKKEPVATEAKTEKAATNKITASKAGHFAVQIGVFSNADSVKDLQMKLLADGLKTHTDIIKTDKGDKIRLRTGSFDSREAAAEVLNSIKTAGVTGMIVAE